MSEVHFIALNGANIRIDTAEWDKFCEDIRGPVVTEAAPDFDT